MSRFTGEIPIHCAYDELIKVSDLKPHPKNRNRHPQEQIERLTKIIKYQGIRSPIKVSRRSGLITAGHGRLEVYKGLKLKVVPVNFQDYETEEQEYADVQSDNAIASWSELDLSGINTDLPELGPDFDIDMLGIKDFVLEPAELIPQADEDAVPEHIEPRSKLGDVYQLGRHRLVCGDSTDVCAVDLLMAGEKADMVFTDPPYNVGIKGKFTGTIKNDSMRSEDFVDFLTSAFASLQIAANGGPFYICYEIKNHSDFHTALKTNGINFNEIIIWNKDSASFYSKNKYNRKFEAIFFVANGNDPSCSGETNVWDAPKSSSFNSFDENGKRFNQEGNYLVAHPTTKPVAIVARAVENHPAMKIVLDLFGGSGSTLIACEKTNRKCFMMEIDPHYVDVIVTRWENYTGKKAELLNG